MSVELGVGLADHLLSVGERALPLALVGTSAHRVGADAERECRVGAAELADHRNRVFAYR